MAKKGIDYAGKTLKSITGADKASIKGITSKLVAKQLPGVVAQKAPKLMKLPKMPSFPAPKAVKIKF